MTVGELRNVLSRIPNQQAGIKFDITVRTDYKVGFVYTYVDLYANDTYLKTLEQEVRK